MSESPISRPRYQLVTYEDASDEVRAIYDDVLVTLGVARLPNWITAMGKNPILLRGNWEKTKATLVQGTIPMLLKELIIFVISTRRGSRYCRACHAHAALNLDKTLSFADLTNLAAGQAYQGMPRAFQVALDVAEKAALMPNELGDEDFDALRGVGYSDAEIGEVLAQADLAVMFNTITSTFQLEIDPEYDTGLPEAQRP